MTTDLKHGDIPADLDEERSGDEASIGGHHDLHQSLTAKWEDSFARLVKFKEEHGHCLVPNRYPDDPHLGSWVSTQRRQYKIMMSESGSTPMTPTRARRLEELGFQWTTKDPRHVPWEARYDELLAFKERFGHTQVPIGWKENTALSNWVSTQRQEYKLMLKGRSTRLTPERISLLDKISFVWEAQRGGPRREQRATELVPEQACPAKFHNKIRKDYAKAMNMAGQNQLMMMMPGSFFPFAMAPGMVMPGMVSSEQTEDGKAKSNEGDDTEESKKTDGTNANPFQAQYYSQMMAAMGWPMAPGSPSANPSMALGFVPFAAPYMMGAAMGQIQSPDAQTSENDGKSGKKRKKTDKISGKKKAKSTDEGNTKASSDDESTENEED